MFVSALGKSNFYHPYSMVILFGGGGRENVFHNRHYTLYIVYIKKLYEINTFKLKKYNSNTSHKTSTHQIKLSLRDLPSAKSVDII